MDNRIYEAGAVPTPPTAPAVPSAGYPTNGEPLGAVNPTLPGAFWFHQVGEELRAVLVAAGIAPSSADNAQLLAALNTMFDRADLRLSKNVAGNTDIVLTAAEVLNGIINLTGALTGNINVIVPAAPRRWLFTNNTTGNFTLTVKTATGTGYAIPQGLPAALFCDGTNVDLQNELGATATQFDSSKKLATMEAVQRALGSYSGLALYAVSAVIPVGDIGKVLFSTGTNVAFTLPSVGLPSAGGVIRIYGNSQAGTTVVRPAGSIMVCGSLGNVASVALGLYETAEFMSAGADWYLVGGSLFESLSSGMGASLASAGYQKLPSGLIIQWSGTGNITAGGSAAITFPIAFPNACLRIIGSAATNVNAIFACPTFNTAGATLYNMGSTTAGFMYIAIGN